MHGVICKRRTRMKDRHTLINQSFFVKFKISYSSNYAYRILLMLDSGSFSYYLKDVNSNRC